MNNLNETAWQGETNPEGYQGPDIDDDTGIVLDNTDQTTHTPETPAKRKKRKKKKEALASDAEKGAEHVSTSDIMDPVIESADTPISLDDLLNDPEFLRQLLAELSKYHVDSQIENIVVKNISYLLLEDI
ncbi:MAG: hypothetical protein WCJ49_08745 [Deltaproteobacteria bacterium]